MPTWTHIILVALSLLTSALGVVEIALQSAVTENFDKYAANGSTSWPEHNRGLRHGLWLTPENLMTGVTDAAIVAGVIAIVCVIVTLVNTVLVIRCSTKHADTRQVSQCRLSCLQAVLTN